MAHEQLYIRLSPDCLYSPSKIVRQAKEEGLISDTSTSPDEALASVIAFGNEHLPQQPDGMVREGDHPEPGWWGARWLLALETLDTYSRTNARRTLTELMGSKHEEPADRGKEVAEMMAPLVRFYKASVSSRIRKALLLCLTGVCALGAMMTFSEREGFRILRESGPAAALEWFLAEDAQSFQENPNIRFGIAWARFSKGDLIASRDICFQLLETELPESVEGNVYYLLGHIYGRTGEFEAARKAFETAIEVFERIGHESNAVKTRLGLARAAMENGDYEGARRTLRNTRVDEVDEKSAAYYYYLHSRMAFLQGNYREALINARLSHQEYLSSGNTNGLADSLSEIGFYLILLGDFEEGFNKTMEAESLIHQIGNTDKHYFNLINFILLRKCEGKSYESMVVSIRDRIAETEDAHLLENLDFALKYDCGAYEEQPARVHGRKRIGRESAIPGGEGEPPDPIDGIVDGESGPDAN